MSASLKSLGVRSRFILVVLLGVVAPIAIVGVWLARTTRASGEALLRSRLDESLENAVRTIGFRWVDERSALLTLSESPALLSALRDGGRLATVRNPSAVESLNQEWLALEGRVDAITVRDMAGVAHGTLERPPAPTMLGRDPTLRVRIPVHDAHSALELGSLEARVRLASLLPPGFWWAGVGGSVPAIFESEGNTSLLAEPMSADLFALDGFEWGGDSWLVARRSIDEPGMRLALAAPTGPFLLPFATAARQGTLVLVLVLIASVVLAVLLTRRITDPLERLAVASDAISRGDLEQRVVEGGPDEIRRLARAFNAMTDSLHRTVQRLSQREALAAVGEFAASLAHEVRNPLTSVRLDLERARERLGDPARVDALVSEALAQIDRLDATVSASLRMARSGHLTLEPVDVRRPIEAAIHAARPVFEGRGAVLFPWSAPSEPVLVRGNAGALEQLFLNLLINAAEALDSGGEAALSLATVGDALTVTVKDNGPGIPAERLPHVLEPFFSTKERGTGLGLPLAQRIAQAHGGVLSIESEPGTGASVRVTLRQGAMEVTGGNETFRARDDA
jgi:signal transduction histidine kinase